MSARRLAHDVAPASSDTSDTAVSEPEKGICAVYVEAAFGRVSPMARRSSLTREIV
jgi:hypothetical protein